MSGFGNASVGGLVQGTNFNAVVETIAAGTAYTLTNSYASITFGTTSPALTLNKVGRWLIMASAQLDYVGATVVAETAGLKLRRTNNTAADVTGGSIVTIDLPVSTTLSHTLGVFHLPIANYTTTHVDDSVAIQATVSAGLGAGTIQVVAAKITAIYLGAN